MNRRRIPYGSKLSVVLTNQELQDIRRCFDDDFGRHALVEGKRLRLDLSLDDIEETQGYVAAEANHTKNAKLRSRLDKLFDKFQKFLDRYNDSGM